MKDSTPETVTAEDSTADETAWWRQDFYDDYARDDLNNYFEIFPRQRLLDTPLGAYGLFLGQETYFAG